MKSVMKNTAAVIIHLSLTANVWCQQFRQGPIDSQTQTRTLHDMMELPYRQLNGPPTLDHLAKTQDVILRMMRMSENYILKNQQDIKANQAKIKTNSDRIEEMQGTIEVP